MNVNPKTIWWAAALLLLLCVAIAPPPVNYVLAIPCAVCFAVLFWLYRTDTI